MMKIEVRLRYLTGNLKGLTITETRHINSESEIPVYGKVYEACLTNDKYEIVSVRRTEK